MTEKEYTRKSKFISLVLRHKPDVIGIKLDRHGWANVNELLTGVQISLQDLEHIVTTDSKQRYSFNEDKTKIRANQGHSVDVDLELKEAKPPNVLYHGTYSDVVGHILYEGIKKQSRQYVHLSGDIETATKVGARRGKPMIMEIDSEKMYEDGRKFYLSKNNVWLTDYIPSKYIIKTIEV